MKRLSPIIFLLLFSVSSTRRKKQGCFTNSGTIKVEERMISNVSNILLYDNIDLVLIEAAEEKIFIEAGEQLQSYIETSLTGETLTIRNSSSCDWLRSANEKVKVTLHVKNIDKIEYYGAGNITTANQLLEDEIRIDSWSGAGNILLNIQAQSITATIHEENADIILKGKAEIANIYTTSRGTMDLRDLEVKHMKITQRSVRDAYVHATQSIDAVIMYKGNVYLKGNPTQRKVQTTNEGRLIDL